VDEAVSHARLAIEDGRWSRLTVQQRKQALGRLAALIEEHREELALLESLDVGKPITEALSFDVPAAAAKIRYSAEAADKVLGNLYSVDPTSLSYELQRPIGVVAGIVGWNFPLLLAATKLGPALAMGNSLVLKPSELTSLSASRVAALAVEAGVPEGVFNVVHGGPGIGAALAHHVDVDLATFTGSTRTGKQLLVASGQSNMKRLLLECGGKAPNIVFADCPDMTAVADLVVQRAFYNQGEVCSASSRLLIQEEIKDKLLALIVERTARLRIEDPLLPSSRFGAIVSHEHQKKILSYIDGAEEQGARIAYCSTASFPFEHGFYVPPVVFDRVDPAHRIAQEEIFGPVLAVITFRDEAEAIRIANGTIYGLSAIVWTRDLPRAHRMTQGLRAGWIVINATAKPAGGIDDAMSVGGHKQSGIGREGGLDGLRAYTSRSAVQVFS
jgi:acyl-CoA reductase-like NAD-dependent aldehyde dehydrogenase